MGLIKAAVTATRTTLADQWKEFFYCDALSSDVLLTRGQKQVGKGSSNTKGNDNIISNGSGIVVADGQCMIIVDQGKVVEISAEPGEFTYDTSSESSIFTGKFGENLVETFKQIGRRITYGGDTGKDQRVYYINTKELMDNKFGTPSPVPFRVVDSKIGLDIDVAVRCSGVYSYQIVDPIRFYANIAGNVSSQFTRSDIESQLKAEFISALQPALGALSALEMRPSQLPAHTAELETSLNTVLSDKWQVQRGIKLISVALSTINLSDEDADLIKEAQRVAMLQNPTLAAATLTAAQADAMKAAAANSAGAMNGFIGMGMATQAGGINANSLFQMGQAQAATQIGQPTTSPAQPAATPVNPVATPWTCSNGHLSTGKFCPECGEVRP